MTKPAVRRAQLPSSLGPEYGDRPLGADDEPPVGAHMVTPRFGYTHHGIYVGEDRVVQYGGLSWGFRRGRVEEVSLTEFAQGRPVSIRAAESRRYDEQEVVRRARRRLGEDRYSVLTNNCEHFCEWCVRGQHRSYQVDDGFRRRWGLMLRLIERLMRHAHPRRAGSSASDCLCLGEGCRGAVE